MNEEKAPDTAQALTKLCAEPVSTTRRLYATLTPSRDYSRRKKANDLMARLDPEIVGFVEGQGGHALGTTLEGSRFILIMLQRVYTMNDGAVLVCLFMPPKHNDATHYSLWTCFEDGSTLWSSALPQLGTPSTERNIALASQGRLDKDLQRHIEHIEEKRAAGVEPLVFEELDEARTFFDYYKTRVLPQEIVTKSVRTKVMIYGLYLGVATYLLITLFARFA